MLEEEEKRVLQMSQDLNKAEKNIYAELDRVAGNIPALRNFKKGSVAHTALETILDDCNGAISIYGQYCTGLMDIVPHLRILTQAHQGMVNTFQLFASEGSVAIQPEHFRSEKARIAERIEELKKLRERIKGEAEAISEIVAKNGNPKAVYNEVIKVFQGAESVNTLAAITRQSQAAA